MIFFFNLGTTNLRITEQGKKVFPLGSLISVSPKLDKFILISRLSHVDIIINLYLSIEMISPVPCKFLSIYYIYKFDNLLQCAKHKFTKLRIIM